jgi:glycosyltransferase involved in cell wall biosynthesis
VTALVASPEHVCCRYRLAALRPFLEQAGHRLELRPWPQTVGARARLGRELRQADAVVLQRKLLPGWQLYLLRRWARLLLFDFDDAIFLRDSYAPKGLHSAGRLRRFAAVVRAADAVVAGNAFLRDQAARWSGADRAQVIPTCVDWARYPLAEHARASEEVHLVWIGSSSTLPSLEAIRPLLEDLGLRWPGLRLKLICDRALRLRHLPVNLCTWSEASEATALADADIGLSSMPDDLWSRGKCGLKVLQYMAAGLPVVANPVGVHVELVRHGETGFLATTPRQWLDAIGRLACDPALRRQMGRAGRRRVEAEFGVTTGAAKWLALLERLGAATARAG